MTRIAASGLRKLGLGTLIALMAAGVPAFAQNAPTNAQQGPAAAQQQSASQDGWQHFGGGWSNQNAAGSRVTAAPAPGPTTATPVQQNQNVDPNAQATAPDESQAAQQEAPQNVPPNPPEIPPANVPASNPQASAWQLTIPTGTYVTVRTNEPLSSDRNQEGDSFTATLVQPVIVNGVIVARRGQTIGGRVAEAKKAGRVSGVSHLRLELTNLTLADGQVVPIQSQLVSLNGGTSHGRDAAAIIGTTGFGAAVGAAAAWGTGAAIGAGAGLVASTIGVLVTRGRPTILYPETQLTFQISAPVTVDTERSPQSFRVANSTDDYSQAPPTGAEGYPPHLAAAYNGYCGPYGCGAYPYYGYYGYYGGFYPYPYPYWGWGWGPGFGFYYGRGFYGYRGGFRGGFHR